MTHEYWLVSNLMKGIGRYNSKEWAIMFAITASALWYQQNKWIFEGKGITTVGLLN